MLDETHQADERLRFTVNTFFSAFVNQTTILCEYMSNPRRSIYDEIIRNLLTKKPWSGFVEVSALTLAAMFNGPGLGSL
jgi:hypothetical protein